MVSENPNHVKRIVIGSYESNWGLPEGEFVRFFCAWDCDSGARLYETESTCPRETAVLLADRYPDAEVVATITAIEPSGRL